MPTFLLVQRYFRPIKKTAAYQNSSYCTYLGCISLVLTWRNEKKKNLERDTAHDNQNPRSQTKQHFHIVFPEINFCACAIILRPHTFY